MIPNPICKVLSSIRTTGVQALLMGGQACVLYGAAEFSRDTDLAIGLDADNLDLLRIALQELQAKVIAVPPFETDYLQRGHAVHFRCAHPDAAGLRVDVMAVMRGVEPFALLWERRTTIESEGETYDLLSLPDLVQAKKTQRDKDWPMIRRLIEAHYFTHRAEPTPARVEFWLREARTPEILREVAENHSEETVRLASQRTLLHAVLAGEDDTKIEQALRAEEDVERAADRSYWAPLKTELETLRRIRHQTP